MPNDFYEKTVEDLIFDNRANIHLHGLPKFRNTSFRQFVLPSGKKMDIISYDIIEGNLIVDIYELKRLSIDTDAVCQAYNYYTELLSITSSRFRSVEIQIIMIGRTFAPIPIFEKMNLPFSVYTYDYKFTGVSFQKHQTKLQPHNTDDNFCFGLWAFGSGLHFPDGQPNTIYIGSEYFDYKNQNPEYHKQLIAKTGNLFGQPIIKEINVVEYKYRETIKTEIFPPQPSWTKEFLKDLPPDELMMDLEIDTSDSEPELIENDTSDFEEEPLECDPSDEIEIDPNEIVYYYPLTIDPNDPKIKEANDFIEWATPNSLINKALADA